MAAYDANGNGFAQQYGYFESRLKVPNDGEGTWPAFWMLGISAREGFLNGTPSYPEVDVMEQYGNDPGRYHTTVHEWKPHTVATSLVDICAGDSCLTDEYHTYGALVIESFITFYFDRNEVFRTPTPTAHHEPLFPIINLVLGSGWSTCGLPDSVFMYVDYIKVWSQPTVGEKPTGYISSPASDSTFSMGDIQFDIEANDSDGSVVRVELWSGTEKVGVDVTYPYSITYEDVIFGDYDIRALIVDNDSNMVFTDTVAISVSPGDHKYRIKDRWKGNYLYEDSSLVKYGAPSVADSSSLWMFEKEGDYYRLKNLLSGNVMNGKNVLGYAECTNLPVNDSLSYWDIVPMSDLYFRLKDPWTSNDYLHVQNQLGYPEIGTKPGGAAYSAQWYFEQVPEGIPSGSISNLDESSVLPVGDIRVDVKAYDSNGSITRVELWINDAKVASDDTIPYSFIYKDVMFGTYELKALLVDNDSNEVFTEIVPVRVTPGNDQFRIRDRWRSKYLYEKENQVYYGTVTENDSASLWNVEVQGAYYQLRNASSGNLINGENGLGYAECSMVAETDSSSYWDILPISDGYVRVKVPWNTTDYLHVQNQLGYAQIGPKPAGAAYSAQWMFEWVDNNAAPQATFEASSVDHTLYLDAGASMDSDGIINEYWWDLGDGNMATGSVLEYEYSQNADYTITLVVQDNHGATDTVSQVVSVKKLLIDTVFVDEQHAGPLWKNLGVYAANAGENIQVKIHTDSTDGYVIAGTLKFFNAATQEEVILDVTSESLEVVGAWYLDSLAPVKKRFLHDGNTGKGTKTVTYKPDLPSGGDWAISMKIAPYKNRARNVPVEIIVTTNNLPKAVLSFETNGLQVVFDAMGSNDSDGEIVSYHWDFGDGTASDQSNPVHAYDSAGSYSVGLTVTDDLGGTMCIGDTVSVDLTSSSSLMRSTQERSSILLERIVIYPNPSMDGKFIIQLPDEMVSGSYTVHTLTGAKVTEGMISENKLQLDLATSKTGIYLLQIEASNGFRSVARIVIEN